MQLTRKELLMKLGAARSQYPAAWRLVDVTVDDEQAAFTYQLNRERLAQVRRREGRYLLRTNLTGNDPAELWRYYIQLVQVEEAFKNLKGDLSADLSPARAAHRGAHLHRLPRLLPARHAGAATPAACPWAHAAQRARQVRGRADARCPDSDHGQPATDPHPLYRASAGTAPLARQATHRVTRPTAAQDHRCTGRVRDLGVVQTYRVVHYIDQRVSSFSGPNPLSWASWGFAVCWGP